MAPAAERRAIARDRGVREEGVVSAGARSARRSARERSRAGAPTRRARVAARARTAAPPAGMGKRASVAGEKAKLQAEIALLESKITGAKKTMGLSIFDALSVGDQSEVNRVFGQSKAEVDMLQAQIKEKKDRIEVLSYQSR